MLEIMTIINVDKIVTPGNSYLTQVSVWMPTGPASEGGKPDVINVVATILNGKTHVVIEEDGTYLALGHVRVDAHGAGFQVESLQAIPTLVPPTAHANAVGTVKITESTLTFEYEAYSWAAKAQIFLEMRAWKKGGWIQEMETVQTEAGQLRQTTFANFVALLYMAALWSNYRIPPTSSYAEEIDAVSRSLL